MCLRDNLERGGCVFFRHMHHDVMEKMDVISFLKFFFVVRAAWDDNTDCIYRSSEALRNNSGYEYAEDFVPVSKKHGFFEKIISMKKNTKLREILDLFADHTGYRITISQFGKNRKVARRQKCVFNWYVNFLISTKIDGIK